MRGNDYVPHLTALFQMMRTGSQRHEGQWLCSSLYSTVLFQLTRTGSGSQRREGQWLCSTSSLHSTVPFQLMRMAVKDVRDKSLCSALDCPISTDKNWHNQRCEGQSLSSTLDCLISTGENWQSNTAMTMFPTRLPYFNWWELAVTKMWGAMTMF